MSCFKNYIAVWLAIAALSTAAMGQSAAIDPNDPVLKMVNDMQASELLVFKDFCAEKYPQLAGSFEAQLKTKLQALYGADYAASVKKVIASRVHKADMRGTLESFNAWPEKERANRCEKLAPSIVADKAGFIDMMRQGMETNLPKLASDARICNTLYPGEKFSQTLLNESIENLYGEGAQAQRKVEAFLAKPETKAELDRQLKFFEDTGWRRDDYKNQCFSNERLRSGVPLPAKVLQPALNSPAAKAAVAAPVGPAPMPDKPAQPMAKAAPTAGQNSQTLCLDFASNGVGPGSSKYIAHNGASLQQLASITRIEGTVRGKTAAEPDKPVSLKLDAAANWRDSGYAGRGPTGGWLSWASSLDTNPDNLLDIRFGPRDGISPGKASVPAGEQSLYLVQRNTKNVQALQSFDSFTLQVCGTSNSF